MSELCSRIDFVGVIVVDGANPNGDPLNGNRPRINIDGYGYISDVCLKSKIRKQLSLSGQCVLNLLPDDSDDASKSTNQRLKSSGIGKSLSRQETYQTICQTWFDARCFGQVAAFFSSKKNTENSVSVGIRGPVSISSARSLDVVFQEISQNHTFAIGREKGGYNYGIFFDKCIVLASAYVFQGSISPQLASKTGFSEEDTEAFKNALLHMFRDDSSSFRPAGSMSLHRLFWFRHNCASGQYSPIAVRRSLTFSPVSQFPFYSVSHDPLPGLVPDVLCGW